MIGMRVGIVAGLLLAALSAEAETVFVEAGRDATLIEDPEGALANGAGPVFFVGRTNQGENSVRRGLIWFDVAAALPGNALLESTRLILYLTPSNPAPRPIALHRLLSDWGEGSSFASGGGGALSLPGDATWIHTFYDDELWVKPGGHYVKRASAGQEVADAGLYVWESTPKMLADVRLWLRAPGRNFGWILIGDETTRQNSKSFSSREAQSMRPLLEVVYHLPGD